MPKRLTNQPLPQDAVEALLTAASLQIANWLGKPKFCVRVSLEQNPLMS